MNRISVFAAVLLVAAHVQAQSPSPAAPSTVAPLMRLLASGRLPAERKPLVVEMICTRGGPDELAVVFKQAVEGSYDDRLQLQVLDLLADAAVNRKVMPAGDLAPISKLLSAKNADVQSAAVKLASLWKLPEAVEPLLAMAADESARQEVREAALGGLAALGDKRSLASLARIAQESKLPAIRVRAVAALVKLDVAAAAKLAALVASHAVAEDDLGPLLDAFLARKGGPDKLAAAWQAKPPNSDVAKVALRHMYSVGRSDAALSNVLSAAAGIATDPKPPTPEEVKQLAAEVVAKGDPARGELVFRRGDLSCLKCHSVSRAGGNVGPELSAVGSISPVDYVVNSIVDPNLAIKEQFVTRVISTVNGETFTGVLIDRDDTRVNLRDAAGKAIAIPKADIDEEFEGKSLMPQGLTKFLTRDELIDLAKFISELGKPGAYAIRTVPSVQRWRVLKQPLPAELQSEVPNVENFRQFVLDARPDAWIAAYGKTAGYLPLAELRPAGAKGPTVLFLQGELHVVTAGNVEIAVASSLPASLWLDAEPFEGQQKVAVELSAGKHRLTVRVELPPQGSPELKLEVSRAASGGAQFEIVNGT